MKGGRCIALTQYYKSSDIVFNIILTELDNNGNMCEIVDKYYEFTINNRKKFKKDDDSLFDDYRDINREERTKFINDKLTKSPIHKNIKNYKN